MATKKKDRISALVAEVESLAKRLRTDIRKRAEEAGLAKNLRKAADQLRKRAAAVAAQVEKYLHELRVELEGRPKAAKRSKPKKKKRPAAKAPSSLA